MPSSSSTSTALRHLFRLRKIQADIRRQWRGESGQPRPNDTMLKSALDTWRNEIPRYGVEEAPSTYLHPLWMANLYDYSVIIMMQEKRDSLQPGDIEDVVSTSDEVCRNFRRLQEEGQVMCYTWSAVSFPHAVLGIPINSLTSPSSWFFNFDQGSPCCIYSG